MNTTSFKAHQITINIFYGWYYDIDIMFITFESRSLLLSKVVYFRK